MAKKSKSNASKEPITIQLSPDKTIELKALKFDDILDYCKTNNQTSWLKEFSNTLIESVDPETNEKKTRRPSYMEIRLAFIKKFFPDSAPKAVKKKTMYDLIDEL